MSGRPNRRQTVVAPIHFIFNLLETQQPVSIWLYEKLDIRMEGKIRVRLFVFTRPSTLYRPQLGASLLLRLMALLFY